MVTRACQMSLASSYFLALSDRWRRSSTRSRSRVSRAFWMWRGALLSCWRDAHGLAFRWYICTRISAGSTNLISGCAKSKPP